MCVYELCDSGDGVCYDQMTFPTYRPFLNEIGCNPNLFSYTAKTNGNPIGLGLVKIDPAQKEGEILSLFVEKDHRSHGVGTGLLVAIEKELTQRGCNKAKVIYDQTVPGALALEHILAKHHWSTPQPRMLLGRAGRAILETAWFKGSRIERPFETFPWGTLAYAEREELVTTEKKSPWVPEFLWPFDYEENLEPCNSLGLRYQNQVVGWVITNRIAPNAIRYSALVIRKEYRGHGRTFALLAESIRLQVQTLGINSIGTFGVWLNNKAMTHIIRKNFAPYLLSLSQTQVSEKKLHGS